MVLRKTNKETSNLYTDVGILWTYLVPYFIEVCFMACFVIIKTFPTRFYTFWNLDALVFLYVCSKIGAFWYEFRST